ncbi:MAG: adenylosuccinate lyase [Chitinivibrionales bacterium]|nr:adenylosuccinate lyase [Chitinivibrionales bacterium]
MTSYVDPLVERYASADMVRVFSADTKFGTWRKLWIALAEAQRELGLPIDAAQLDEMAAHTHSIDYDRVRAIEAETRHDVMAHLRAFGEQCPSAKPIMHLGATSAFVGDNTDLIQLRDATDIVLRRLVRLIHTLRGFALDNRETATLGFTHYQPAQLTTVGKRACLWLLDLTLDLDAVRRFRDNLPMRGAKGTTGTQASYLALFDGDHEKVQRLDEMVARAMGFERVLPVTGQTYTRKIDANAAALLSGLAQSLHKMANDIRLLQNLKEIEEPFEKGQVGSSAMAYKRNPMRSERLTALCRHMIALSAEPAMTAAEQWFERTLDDSASKRLSMPGLFMAADAALIVARSISDGLVVYPRMIERHIAQELPFMATENILMAAVKQGGDRQELHERIRQHAVDAARRVKVEGGDNDLLERIAGDQAFGMSREQIDAVLDVRAFVGRAPQQVDEFIAKTVDPLLKESAAMGDIDDVELSV